MRRRLDTHMHTRTDALSTPAWPGTGKRSQSCIPEPTVFLLCAFIQVQQNRKYHMPLPGNKSGHIQHGLTDLTHDSNLRLLLLFIYGHQQQSRHLNLMLKLQSDAHPSTSILVLDRTAKERPREARRTRLCEARVLQVGRL